MHIYCPKTDFTAYFEGLTLHKASQKQNTLIIFYHLTSQPFSLQFRMSCPPLPKSFLIYFGKMLLPSMPRTTEIQTSSSVGTHSVLLFTPVPSVSQGSPLPFPQPNFHLEVNGFLQLVGTILLRTRLPPLVFTHSVPSTASHWPFASPSAEHCSQPCAPVGLAAR